MSSVACSRSCVKHSCTKDAQCEALKILQVLQVSGCETVLSMMLCKEARLAFVSEDAVCARGKS